MYVLFVTWTSYEFCERYSKSDTHTFRKIKQNFLYYNFIIIAVCITSSVMCIYVVKITVGLSLSFLVERILSTPLLFVFMMSNDNFENPTVIFGSLHV